MGWMLHIGMGTVLRWILGWMPHVGKDAAYQDGGRVLGWMPHTRVDAAYWGGVVSIRMSGEHQDGQSMRMGEKNKDGGCVSGWRERLLMLGLCQDGMESIRIEGY